MVLGGVLSHAGGHDVEPWYSARSYILHIHTRPTVAWDPPPGFTGRAGSVRSWYYRIIPGWERVNAAFL